MSKLVYISSPNTEKPWLEVQVWTPDIEDSEQIPDTLTSTAVLQPGEQLELVLEEKQYILISAEALSENE